MKKLEIMKIGSVTAKNGKTYNFTELDLRRVAESYNPHLFRAPLIIGHPEEEAPAYGYVQALFYDNGKLLAEPAKIDTQFAAMVNSGKYPNLSASFYAPHSPGNPTPYTLYLRHVGFLGAWPPAVKGLALPEFGERGSHIIEFSGDSTMSFAGGTIPWNLTRYV